MRIAFAHTSSADDISGVTSWLIQLALFLKNKGCEVAIHLLNLDRDDPITTLEHSLENSGIALSQSPPSGNLHQDIQATLNFLNRWQPDVFLPQCKTPHDLAAAIAGRCGLPWVFTLYSDDPDSWAVCESLPPRSHGGRTICISRHIQASLTSRGGESNAAVIPCGVAIPTTTTVLADHLPFQVVSSGRLWEHQKRATLVTQSLIRACQRGEGRLTATLIGDGCSRAACEQLVGRRD